jgi:hypothetical protein
MTDVSATRTHKARCRALFTLTSDRSVEHVQRGEGFPWDSADESAAAPSPSCGRCKRPDRRSTWMRCGVTSTRSLMLAKLSVGPLVTDDQAERARRQLPSPACQSRLRSAALRC